MLRMGLKRHDPGGPGLGELFRAKLIMSFCIAGIMNKESVSFTQKVRLVDVFLLGPFMIWFGVAAEGVAEWTGVLMIVSGVATVLYNAKNYLINAGVLRQGL